MASDVVYRKLRLSSCDIGEVVSLMTQESRSTICASCYVDADEVCLHCLEHHGLVDFLAG